MEKKGQKSEIRFLILFFYLFLSLYSPKNKERTSENMTLIF